MVNSVTVMYSLDADKEDLTKRKIIFRHVDSAFIQLYCLKFSFQLANISKAMHENSRVPLISVQCIAYSAHKCCCCNTL